MITVEYTVHIRVFAMFTETFRVKGGGRFRATTFLFPHYHFQCRCRSLGYLQLQRHSQKPFPSPPPPPDFQYLMNSPHYYSRYRKYFLHFGSLFPFQLNHLKLFILEYFVLGGGGGGGKTIETWWRWWWWRKTIEFYSLQNYINAQHAAIFSVYILLLRS